MVDLRPDQAATLDSLKAAIANGARRPLLQAPTGAGKTVIAGPVVNGALAKRKRVAFCFPLLGLLDQTVDRFIRAGIDANSIGVVQADHAWRRPDAPVQLVSIPTLARRKDRPDVDVVLVDEAHLRFGAIEKWMAEAPNALFIGLSATPWSRGLGNVYDALVKGPSLANLIKLGILSEFTVFAASAPDLEGVRTDSRTGDFREDDLLDRVSKPTLVADVVTNWIDKAEGRPTLAFCVNRAHARLLTQQFQGVGVPVRYVDAMTPRAEREEIGLQLKTGEVKVVCNIGTMTTGVDLPHVSSIVLARPTKSEMLLCQMLGRGLRSDKDSGKQNCLIFDHSTTTSRLGLVTDLDRDELDTSEKGKSEARRKDKDQSPPLPKCCKSCAALSPAHVAECVHCGEPFPIRRVVEVTEGELVRVSGKATKGDNTPVGERIRAMGKQVVWSQLLGHQLSPRGKSLGFYKNTYREVFGVWPRGLDEVAARPSIEVENFIRAKLIRFAKSRGAYSVGAGVGYAG